MPSEIREVFLSVFIRGDFINNQLHSQATNIRLLLEDSDNEDLLKQLKFEVPRFLQIYGDGGKRNWIVSMFMESLKVKFGQQDVSNIKTLSELLKQYPDLQKDIDYADFLAEKFGDRLTTIIIELNRDQKTNRETISQKLNDAIAQIAQLRRETNDFHFESDVNYQKYLEKKASETVRPQEGERK